MIHLLASPLRTPVSHSEVQRRLPWESAYSAQALQRGFVNAASWPPTHFPIGGSALLQGRGEILEFSGRNFSSIFR